VLPLVSNPEYEALAPEIAIRAEAEAAATKIAKIRSLESDKQGVVMDLHVRRGEEPYQEIVDEARERNTELIILRRRGKRGFLAKLMMGEMVSKVLAHAPCHVLFAPRGARMWSRCVLVAAEPGVQGLRLVSTAAAIAAECGLPLHLIYVTASDKPAADTDSFLAQAKKTALNSGIALQTQVRHGKAFAEIIAAGAAVQADLLVIGSRNDSHVGHAMIGGVAQKIIGLSDNPVLALNLT
jgi:nucleotide-binding universal stress UspA family protein